MKQPVSNEVVKTLAEISKAAGGIGEIHVVGVRVCDHCHNENEEAFPYGVEDAEGNWWDDLCNDCFDKLGCSYPWWDKQQPE